MLTHRRPSPGLFDALVGGGHVDSLARQQWHDGLGAHAETESPFPRFEHTVTLEGVQNEAPFPYLAMPSVRLLESRHPLLVIGVLDMRTTRHHRHRSIERRYS